MCRCVSLLNVVVWQVMAQHNGDQEWFEKVLRKGVGRRESIWNTKVEKRSKVIRGHWKRGCEGGEDGGGGSLLKYTSFRNAIVISNILYANLKSIKSKHAHKQSILIFFSQLVWIKHYVAPQLGGPGWHASSLRGRAIYHRAAVIWRVGLGLEAEPARHSPWLFPTWEHPQLFECYRTGWLWVTSPRMSILGESDRRRQNDGSLGSIGAHCYRNVSSNHPNH